MHGSDFALAPLSCVYRSLVWLRNLAYDVKVFPIFRVPIPVISVGNITAGGNGKTPLCLYLSRRLALLGRRPVILSRGYGGSASGPLVVTAAAHPAEVGDEPVMMAQEASVVVARDRVRGAQYIVENKLGDVIVLDDGFQHRRLARDVDIVCVYGGSSAARNSFKLGRLLPWGRFRESRERGLGRAHIIVVAKRGQGELTSAELQELQACFPGNTPVCQSIVSSLKISDRDGKPLPHRARVVCFCSLGNPDAFFETVVASGYEVVEKRAYADHAVVPVGDLAQLTREHPGAALVCSRKDWVKLSPEFQNRAFVVDIETTVVPEEDLWKLINKALFNSGDRLC